MGMNVPLYKLFGGFNTEIINNTQTKDTMKSDRPTIYIASHRFSFMDILVTFEIFARLSVGTRENPRILSGVSDTPELLKIIVTLLLNFWCSKMLMISYSKRYGNTTKEMAKYLYWGDDIVIWQHPYNKSRGLYYILHKCIYEYGVTPRLVYIDITDKMTNETINNESVWNIIRKTRNKTYYATSHEIEYTIEREITDDIYKQFTEPFWDQVCAKLKG
jgi:hypothetical protein